MPALPITKQSDWNNNVYVLTTIRVVVMILVAYLIKSLYNAVPSIWGWGARPSSVAAVVENGIDLENIVSDTLVTVPGVAVAGPDLEIDPTLEVRPPQPTYNPHDHTERSRASTRAQYQGMEASGHTAAAQAMPEQEGDLRNGDRHVEEDMDVTVSNARRDTSIESVADEEIGGTPA